MILSSNNYIILRISSFRAIPKVRYCQRTVPNNHYRTIQAFFEEGVANPKNNNMPLTIQFKTELDQSFLWYHEDLKFCHALSRLEGTSQKQIRAFERGVMGPYQEAAKLWVAKLQGYSYLLGIKKGPLFFLCKTYYCWMLAL